MEQSKRPGGPWNAGNLTFVPHISNEHAGRRICCQRSIIKCSQEPIVCLKRPRLWNEFADPHFLEATIVKRLTSAPFGPAVLLIAICALVFAAWWKSRPQEFRGTLRYPVIAVGFETTGVALVTPEGTYELALPRTARQRDRLRTLNGHKIVVTGKLTTRKGKWRPVRHVIYVEDFKVERQGTS